MREKINSEEYCLKIISKCPSFKRCSINTCPLDPNWELRTNPERRICKWMREAKKIALKGEKRRIQFVSGGKPMPISLLGLIPLNAAKNLNQASYKKWLKIYGN